MGYRAQADHAAVVNVLGGSDNIGTRVRTCLDVVRAIEQGFHARAAESLCDHFRLKREDLCSALGIGIRSLAQRKRTGRLRPDESERLWRVARVLCRAESVYGDPETAAMWIGRPAAALGSARPIDVLRWELGGELVSHLLGQIEYGTAS